MALVLLAWPLLASPAPPPALIDDDAAVDRVLELVVARLDVMPRVAATKWQSGAPVTDPAREQAVLDRAGIAAESMGLSAPPARAVLATQMRLSREVQQRLHAEWRQRGCDVCSPAPDLAGLRTELDRIDSELLRALYIARPVLERADFVDRYRGSAATTLARAVPSIDDREELLARLHELRGTGAIGLARIRQSGLLRIATTGDYDPFTLEAGGELRGADVELGLRLAERLGARPVFVRTTWSSLLNDLAADRYDVAIGGIAVTPERQAHGLFSVSYQSGGKTILARCRDRRRFDTLAEVDRRAVRVIVNPGGTNERYVRSHLHRAQVIVQPDNRAVFEELIAGRADAMITDDVEADLQAHRHPELCRTLPGTLTRADKAIFMVQDAALLDAVNDWLSRAIAQGVPARLLQDAMSR
jgi:cyclohexadienyl dehydratase